MPAGFVLQIDDQGADAVVTLGRGDMRQTLNILQSVVMAHGSVSEEYAYLCTGNPPPAMIEAILDTLLNQEMGEAYKAIYELQVLPIAAGRYVWKREVQQTGAHAHAVSLRLHVLDRMLGQMCS